MPSITNCFPLTATTNRCQSTYLYCMKKAHINDICKSVKRMPILNLASWQHALHFCFSSAHITYWPVNLLAPFTWENESGLREFGAYGNPATGRPSLLVAQWTEMEAAEQQSWIWAFRLPTAFLATRGETFNAEQFINLVSIWLVQISSCWCLPFAQTT
jgi:hypothetical protein